MTLFSYRLNEALGRQKCDILSEIEDKIVSFGSTSRRREQGDYSFKYQGNKRQFQFNKVREDDLRDLRHFILKDQTGQALELVDKSLTELQERNIIIKIGDSHGWDTVTEYVDSPFTDGPDDAARLRQAETRAIRKRKSKDNTKPYARVPQSGSANQQASFAPGQQLVRPFGGSYGGGYGESGTPNFEQGQRFRFSGPSELPRMSESSGEPAMFLLQRIRALGQ